MASPPRPSESRREWTQEELAVRAGIALSTYQQFERTGRISLERLLKLAVVLGKKRLMTVFLPLDPPPWKPVWRKKCWSGIA